MEYSLEFAERLIESADALCLNSHKKEQTDRTVLYLSSLSCEISLKALLESNGYSLAELKRDSHRLDILLKSVCNCKIKGTNKCAVSLRAQLVVKDSFNGTVGTLLDSVLKGASKYPNEIRYGEKIRHFPPEFMLNCAKIVNAWCKEHKGNLVRPQQ